MAALAEGTGFFVSRSSPECGMKTLLVSCKNSVDNGDTLVVDIAKYGGGAMCGVIGWIHSTENSIVIQEQPTTTMSGSELTITVGGATPNKTRHYLIFLGPTRNP